MRNGKLKREIPHDQRKNATSLPGVFFNNRARVDAIREHYRCVYPAGQDLDVVFTSERNVGGTAKRKAQGGPSYEFVAEYCAELPMLTGLLGWSVQCKKYHRERQHILHSSRFWRDCINLIAGSLQIPQIFLAADSELIRFHDCFPTDRRVQFGNKEIYSFDVVDAHIDFRLFFPFALPREEFCRLQKTWNDELFRADLGHCPRYVESSLEHPSLGEFIVVCLSLPRESNIQAYQMGAWALAQLFNMFGTQVHNVLEPSPEVKDHAKFKRVDPQKRHLIAQELRVIKKRRLRADRRAAVTIVDLDHIRTAKDSTTTPNP